VILADFCRKPGPMTKALTKRFARMDAIFATAGNWKSAEDFKDMLGELEGGGAPQWGRGLRGGVCAGGAPDGGAFNCSSTASRTAVMWGMLLSHSVCACCWSMVCLQVSGTRPQHLTRNDPSAPCSPLLLLVLLLLLLLLLLLVLCGVFPAAAAAAAAGSQGLKVVSDTVWTPNVRGFWKVGTFELLFRKDHPKQTKAQRLTSGIARVSLRLRGGCNTHTHTHTCRGAGLQDLRYSSNVTACQQCSAALYQAAPGFDTQLMRCWGNAL